MLDVIFSVRFCEVYGPFLLVSTHIFQIALWSWGLVNLPNAWFSSHFLWVFPATRVISGSSDHPTDITFEQCSKPWLVALYRGWYYPLIYLIWILFHKPIYGSLRTNQYNGMSAEGFERCSIDYDSKCSSPKMDDENVGMLIEQWNKSWLFRVYRGWNTTTHVCRDDNKRL